MLQNQTERKVKRLGLMLMGLTSELLALKEKIFQSVQSFQKLQLRFESQPGRVWLC